ncbi:MAG: FAD-dependent monooxygenase [Bryobacteraceae bacterium]
MQSSDVFVVGGGPAGLGAAIALRLKGYSVKVADCAVPPVEKACGEGLMPDSQAALRKLGVVVPSAHGFPFRGVRLIEGHTTVQGDFPDGVGLGVRRPVLQQLLIQRAEQLGVELQWGITGIDLRAEGLFVRKKRVDADLIVAADGHKSLLRRRAGLEAARRLSFRYGFRRHYRVAPWSEYMESYWGDGFQIYVTPVAPDEVCVVLMSSHAGFRLDNALALAPAVSRRLEGHPYSSNEMGALTVSRKLKRVCKPGFALVGDASGSVDAITGEGLCLSFKAALALADAYAAGDLTLYQRAHERFQVNPSRMASLLLLLGRHPRLRRRVLAAFACRPDVFSRLLAIHVGASSFHEFKPNQILSFSREFLFA